MRFPVFYLDSLCIRTLTDLNFKSAQVQTIKTLWSSKHFLFYHSIKIGIYFIVRCHFLTCLFVSCNLKRSFVAWVEAYVGIKRYKVVWMATKSQRVIARNGSNLKDMFNSTFFRDRLYGETFILFLVNTSGNCHEFESKKNLKIHSYLVQARFFVITRRGRDAIAF